MPTGLGFDAIMCAIPSARQPLEKKNSSGEKFMDLRGSELWAYWAIFQPLKKICHPARFGKISPGLLVRPIGPLTKQN